MPSKKPTPPRPVNFQISHAGLRTTLRETMRVSTGGHSSMEYRVSAALDALLAAHFVDERGRCESCRSGMFLSRGRPQCLIYVTALYWLRHVH